MLVVERKEGESISVENFEVRILKVRNGRAKIGILAPRGVNIMRTELLEKVEKSHSKQE